MLFVLIYDNYALCLPYFSTAYLRYLDENQTHYNNKRNDSAMKPGFQQGPLQTGIALDFFYLPRMLYWVKVIERARSYLNYSI